MKFDLFKNLYIEALEIDTLDLYIAERGWQDWMDDYSPAMVTDVLTRIHTLANNPLKDTRGATQVEFARKFAIPVRTIENWDSGTRKAPEYVKMLIDFALFND